MLLPQMPTDIPELICLFVSSLQHNGDTLYGDFEIDTADVSAIIESIIFILRAFRFRECVRAVLNQ